MPDTPEAEIARVRLRREYKLTALQALLVYELLANREGFLSLRAADRLVETGVNAWKLRADGYDAVNVRKVAISHARKRIAPSGATIKNLWGSGYILENAEALQAVANGERE